VLYVQRQSAKLQKICSKMLTKSWPLAHAGIKRGLVHLAVTRMPCLSPGASVSMGRLHAGFTAVRCSLGRAGIRYLKQEGDHATPAGAFRLLAGLFRADRVPRHDWLFPVRKLQPDDGWCDDPASPLYNRPAALPCRARHEKLWREDRLYDLVIVLGYNFHPRRKYRGSAIFLHCARPDLGPTEGCIALRLDDLRRLLPRLSRKAVLTIR
jgi:L,D-peptidoglycan transpeptidase YkuD (ErfK/YbiS/YcfS/YnhG family)